MTVLGTRPEIIKMSPVVRACREAGVPHVLVHTGQHYSYELDEAIFRDLELAPADVNLHIGSRPDGDQIRGILAKTVAIIERERPDVVVVQGDTNSALGGALAAVKTATPLAHVEAGLRSYDRTMPEEINRRQIDHVADFLFAPTRIARDTLLTEGVDGTSIVMSGNTVVDELERLQGDVPDSELLAKHGLRRRRFALATVHRRENVENEERLRGILAGIASTAIELELPVVAALHPRTVKKIDELGIAIDAKHVRVVPPLGYREFLALHANAALMLTDSGGLQEEACCLGVPCVTLRDNTERPESIAVGASTLAGARERAIVERARELYDRPRTWPNPFGDGHAGRRIVEQLERLLAR
ncbi:MAG: UDP-N-acetylglucosamine 2-epimerase (non-hydrolyzing) [Myxococcota bacterium]